MSKAAPPFAGFSPAALAFLADLEAHNDQAWFKAHKKVYDAELVAPAKAFVVAVGERLRALAPAIRAEPRVNGSIFRINRDTRFSADKTPYKPHLDLWFWEGEDRSWACSGFYFRLRPQSLHLGAGMHQFDKDVLAAYRQAVADDARGAALVEAIAAVEAHPGYRVEGSHYQRVPRGFPADHPRGELLKYNGLHSGREQALPAQIHGPELVDFCVGEWEKLLPLHRWMAAAARGR